MRYDGHIDVSEGKGLIMKKVAKVALVVVAVGAVACAIAHRRVIVACVKGEALPEAPAWHKQCGLH